MLLDEVVIMKIEYVLTDIRELSYKKNITEDLEIEIDARTNYYVYYSDDGNSCIGEFTVEFVSVENPEQLQMRYSSKSLFNLYDVILDDETKKEIHIDIFNRIYPMCNETIKNFSAMSGVPNISLPPMDISAMEIVINS